MKNVLYIFQHNESASLIVWLKCCETDKHIITWTLPESVWSHGKLKMVQNEDGDDDLDFPLSKSVTCLAVIHRYHSAGREVQPWVWCVVSHLCSPHQAENLQTFITLSLVLTFFLDAAYLQIVVKRIRYFSFQLSKRKQCYINELLLPENLHFHWTASGKAPFPDLSVWEVCTSLAVTILGPVLLCPW